MEITASPPSEAASSLAMAIVVSSQAPMLLLDGSLTIMGASISFCSAFQLDPATIVDARLCDLGQGEWKVPQLESLLMATASGKASINAYAMDLVRKDKPTCHLLLNAHRLDYGDVQAIRIMLTVTDMTAVRSAERLKDDLLRDKQILLLELHHRVANSLQIIASVLIQSARKVQSDETRLHLHDAHDRVMAIATLQRQLAASRTGNVALRGYFGDLCHSIGASMIHNPDDMSLTTHVDESTTTSEVSVSLGLIVTELIINALKHAFPRGTRDGRIVVDYRSQGSGWTMSVTDNGIGMPPASAPVKPGLGTGLVNALSKNLEASVIVTALNPGTRVSIIHL